MERINLKESSNSPYKKYWHVYSGKLRAGKIYIEEKDNSSWINIFINKPLQSKGIGFKALKLVCLYVPKPLFAEIRKGNIASQRIFRKVGFKEYDKNKSGGDILVLN
jgi:RimJ/RimL family protein N-acetyltransferase